jgi:hypothetical protein
MVAEQKIPIVVFATDDRDSNFHARTSTIFVSPGRARIRLGRTLRSGVKVLILNLQNGQEAEFVVEHSPKPGEVDLVQSDPSRHIWDSVEPPVPSTHDAARPGSHPQPEPSGPARPTRTQASVEFGRMLRRALGLENQPVPAESPVPQQQIHTPPEHPPASESSPSADAALTATEPTAPGETPLTSDRAPDAAPPDRTPPAPEPSAAAPPPHPPGPDGQAPLLAETQDALRTLLALGSELGELAVRIGRSESQVENLARLADETLRQAQAARHELADLRDAYRQAERRHSELKAILDCLLQQAAAAAPAPTPLRTAAAPSPEAASQPSAPPPAPTPPPAPPAQFTGPVSWEDRRRSRRVRLRTIVRIRRGNTIELRPTLDLSRAGLSFESARNYPLGGRIELVVHYREDDMQVVEAPGRIARIIPGPATSAGAARTSRYGVEFLPASPLVH